MTNKYLEKIAFVFLGSRLIPARSVKTLFHGTSPSNAAKIKARGLVPNAAKGHDTFHKLSTGRDLPKGYNYLTSNPEVAAQYALGAKKIEKARSNGYKGINPNRFDPSEIKSLVRRFKGGGRNTGIVKVNLPKNRVKFVEEPNLTSARKTFNSLPQGERGTVQAKYLKEILDKSKKYLVETKVTKDRISRRYLK